jgi:hypothetical protein
MTEPSPKGRLDQAFSVIPAGWVPAALFLQALAYNFGGILGPERVTADCCDRE